MPETHEATLKEESDIVASCGCVFCDLDIPAVKRGSYWQHRTAADGRVLWVDCTKVATFKAALF